MKIFLIVLLVFIAFSVICVCMAISKQKHLNSYKEVYKGMPQKEALKIMGGGFTKQEMPKFISYTWKIDSKYYQGSVKRVVLHIDKDGLVEDVQTFKD